MGDHTAIEWTDASWTPVRARNRQTGKLGWHCEHVSEACRFCYADERVNARFGTGLAYKPGNRDKVELFLDDKMLLQPLHWRRPRKIFVCSTTDLFADFVTDEWIDRIFAVMALCPQHTFQVLTKRPVRMRKYVAQARERIVKRTAEGYPNVAVQTSRELHSQTIVGGEVPWPLPNVWLGTSIEDQATADERVPLLLDTPAAIRFVSAEPLLGPIDLTEIDYAFGSLQISIPREPVPPTAMLSQDDTLGTVVAAMSGSVTPNNDGLDWVIAGGESGRHARPMHPDWARSLRDQCKAASVPFFFKQWGEWAPQPLVGKADGCFIGNRWSREIPFNPGGIAEEATCMARVGKHAAGATLDGREWRQFPDFSTAPSLPFEGRPKAAQPASGGGKS